MKKLLFLLGLFGTAYGQTFSFPTVTDASGNLQSVLKVNGLGGFYPGVGLSTSRPNSTTAVPGWIRFDSDSAFGGSSGSMIVNVGVASAPKYVRMLTSLDATTGGTGISGLTATRIPIAASSTSIADNANLFYSGGLNTNKLLLPLSGGATPGFLNGNSSNANYAVTHIYPQTATNVTNQIFLIPKGTGNSGDLVDLYLWGTDYVANQTNYEVLGLNVTGTSMNVASTAGGTGAVRPIKLYTGANTSQLVLNIDGTVNMGSSLSAATSVISPLLLSSGYNTTANQVTAGDLGLQSVNINNKYLFDNMYWNGSVYKAKVTGASEYIYMGAQSVSIALAPSVSAGATATPVTYYYMPSTGHSLFTTTTDVNALIGIAASTTTIANMNLAVGTKKTTMVQGDISASSGHLYYHDGSTDYDLLASTGGSISGLTAGRVPYSASATTIADDGNFLWNTTNKTMTITGTANPQVILKYDASHLSTLQTDINGNLNFGSTGGTAILPFGNNTYSLGAYGATWNNGFFNNVNVYLNVAVDANLNTGTLYSRYVLPVITANRTITLGAWNPGTELTFLNTNTSGFAWSWASTIKDLTNTTVTTFPNGTKIILFYDGTTWWKTN